MRLLQMQLGHDTKVGRWNLAVKELLNLGQVALEVALTAARRTPVILHFRATVQDFEVDPITGSTNAAWVGLR